MFKYQPGCVDCTPCKQCLLAAVNAAQAELDAARVPDAAQGRHERAAAPQQAALPRKLALPCPLGPRYGSYPAAAHSKPQIYFVAKLSRMQSQKSSCSESRNTQHFAELHNQTVQLPTTSSFSIQLVLPCHLSASYLLHPAVATDTLLLLLLTV